MKPFKYGCVVSGDNFCPRPELERQLREFAATGQNLVIHGARRMGKTSLVKHAIGGMRGMRMIYIDLYYVKSLREFCARAMKGIAKASGDLPFLKKALQFAFRLRPALAIDPRDGSTTITVDSKAAAEPDSLGAVMETLEKLAAGGRTCVVFDEFQDILKLDNAMGILAEMRGAIQFQENTPYFFTGSVRNDMMRIFDDMDSPFYKSALPFAVDAIDPVAFGRFIEKRFKGGGRKIAAPAIARILAFADGVSGDVQELCETLWETTEAGDEITENRFPAAFDLVFSRELGGYEAIVDRLTPGQMTVLRALAESPEASVYSHAFTSRVGMAASSVQRTMRKLTAARLVYVRQGAYRFSNPFFREWLVTQ
jgi:hypothetical protein